MDIMATATGRITIRTVIRRLIIIPIDRLTTKGGSTMKKVSALLLAVIFAAVLLPLSITSG